MRLDLAFWGPWDASEDEARADVERQAREWAAAEPKVTGCTILEVSRNPDNPARWIVSVDLTFEHLDNLTLWPAA